MEKNALRCVGKRGGRTMKDTIYITFNEKKVIKMSKSRPDDQYSFRLDVEVEPKFFTQLNAKLHIDENADLTLKGFEIEINKLKKGL